MTKIPVCPKCRNPHIRRTTTVSGWLTPDQWICDKCGYMGYVIHELDTEDFKEEDKKKE